MYKSSLAGLYVITNVLTKYIFEREDKFLMLSPIQSIRILSCHHNTSYIATSTSETYFHEYITQIFMYKVYPYSTR